MMGRRSTLSPGQVETARRISILTIARRLNLGEPVPHGHEWAVLCPLHDDHNPSLHLNPDRNVWFCFVCGEGGDGIKLVQRVTGLGFVEAVTWIAGSRGKP